MQLMASSAFLQHCCFCLALVCFSTSLCKSDENSKGIFQQATSCFFNHYIYVSCPESYRLSEEGSIGVSPEGADEFCEGPCLVETKLVLDCVERALHDFRFYNGASVLDISYSLNTGCSHTKKRGDFSIRTVPDHNSQVVPDPNSQVVPDHTHSTFDYYDDGNKLSIPVSLVLLILSSSLLLLWSN